MDCSFHDRVPATSACTGCGRMICSTCDRAGSCPSCRIGQRLSGGVAPRAAATAERPVGVETRALVALGYPVWPLAALALLDPKRSPYVRRQALQALGLNFGACGLWLVLGVIGHIPILGLSAWPLLALLFPALVVADVVYAVKVWNGDDVRVPLVSDWLDQHEAERYSVAGAPGPTSRT